MKLKSLLVIVAFLMLQVSGFGQIKYEATQNEDLNALVMDNGEKIFTSYNKTGKTMKLYHADHSEWKSIPLNIPRKHRFDELKSVSVNVFNTDALVELAYTSLEYLSNNDTEVSTNHVSEEYTLYIMNEKGSMLMEEKNGHHLEVVDTYGTRKLWVYRQAGPGNENKNLVDVYSLPDAPVPDLNIDKSKGEYRATGDQKE